MTPRSAADMALDVDVLLVKRDDGHRRVHCYTADDGTTLTVELTDLEAYLLETLWFGTEVATENYHRVDD